MALMYEGLDQMCDHGLTFYGCGWCRSKMATRPYRAPLVELFLVEPLVEDARAPRLCELCPKRRPTKGNRVTVRLPRPPLNAWGQGVPDHAPSFAGPSIEAPRIYKATHRMARGSYSCDRCDPSWQKHPERWAPKDKVKATGGAAKASDLYA